MSPPIIHAAKTSFADPTARAMSLVTRKMPVPIVSLITIAVADHRPKARTRSDRSEGLVGLGLVALTKADRAYYQGLGWSTNDASWQASRKFGSAIEMRANIDGPGQLSGVASHTRVFSSDRILGA